MVDARSRTATKAELLSERRTRYITRYKERKKNNKTKSTKIITVSYDLMIRICDKANFFNNAITPQIGPLQPVVIKKHMTR